jgi:hypothetical protein
METGVIVVRPYTDDEWSRMGRELQLLGAPRKPIYAIVCGTDTRFAYEMSHVPILLMETLEGLTDMHKGIDLSRLTDEGLIKRLRQVAEKDRAIVLS